jgi:NAD dependent epimerase/dehydratase family
VVQPAAAVGVKLILDLRLYSLKANILGTANVLEAAARHGGQGLVASTPEGYGKNPASPLTETADVISISDLARPRHPSAPVAAPRWSSCRTAKPTAGGSRTCEGGFPTPAGSLPAPDGGRVERLMTS